MVHTDIGFTFNMNSDLGDGLFKIYRNTSILATWVLINWPSDLSEVDQQRLQ